jgi:hypothetical protein
MNSIRFSRYMTLISYIALIGVLLGWYGIHDSSPVVLIACYYLWCFPCGVYSKVIPIRLPGVVS